MLRYKVFLKRIHVDEKSNLRIQPVTVVWRKADSVLIKGGLMNGDQVILSRIAAPVEGMLLRQVSKESETHAKGTQSEENSDDS